MTIVVIGGSGLIATRRVNGLRGFPAVTPLIGIALTLRAIRRDRVGRAAFT